MTSWADSSFIVSLCLDDRHTERARRYLAASPAPLTLTVFSRGEVEHALRLCAFRGEVTVPRMTQDCIDTMKAMNVKIAFLPLGVLSDLVKHPELRSNVVERLKVVGAQAEKAGVIIGVETELDADAQIKLLDDVGSPAIRIYYNFANAIQNNRDLIKELRALGKDRICQIHCTDQDGVWLQNDPKINMQNVKSALDEMGWSGWLVIERSRDAKDSRNVKKNYGANTAYLKSVFQKQ